MTTTSTRYDFARCLVDHLAPYHHQVPMWGASSVGTMSKPGVVLRVKQSNFQGGAGPDEAQFTLLDCDARMLARQILDIVGDE